MLIIAIALHQIEVGYSSSLPNNKSMVKNMKEKLVD
jgi:hypothetical protein